MSISVTISRKNGQMNFKVEANFFPVNSNVHQILFISDSIGKMDFYTFVLKILKIEWINKVILT